MTWHFKFARYDSKTGKSRISSVQFRNAEDFHAAYSIACHTLDGMRAADPLCRYSIVSISSNDFHGEDCDGGIHPFETKAEMQARIDAAK